MLSVNCIAKNITPHSLMLHAPCHVTTLVCICMECLSMIFKLNELDKQTYRYVDVGTRS